MKTPTSYPSDSRRCPAIFVSRAFALAGDSKMTLPLAMNVSTLESPSPSNRARSWSILTTRPPTLMARRKAMWRGMASIVGPRVATDSRPQSYVPDATPNPGTRRPLLSVTGFRAGMAIDPHYLFAPRGPGHEHDCHRPQERPRRGRG